MSLNRGKPFIDWRMKGVKVVEKGSFPFGFNRTLSPVVTDLKFSLVSLKSFGLLSSPMINDLPYALANLKSLSN